jgi:LysM repeat protein
MALVDFGLGNVKADLSSFPVIGDDIKKDTDEIVEKPAKKEVVAEKPAAEAPVVEKSAEKTVAEEPVAEKPAAKAPEAKAPVAEKPSAEEPVVEEPSNDLSAADPASDGIGDEDVVYDDEEENSGSKSWLWALIGCVVGLACGYLLGNYFPFTASSQEPQPQEQVAPAKPVVAQKDSVLTDSLETVGEPAEEVAKAVEAAKPEESAKADAPKAEPAKAAEDPTAELSAKYAAKDNRVRLGAYHIVGTDKVIKAKEGQTLGKISRTYLGPDMECYMEVYNDMKASDVLKAGQEVKIPKLVWKRAARAKSAK